MPAITRDHDQTNDDIQRIKWGGWAIIVMVGLGWGGWLSLMTIANASAITQIDERQANQYQRLRDDIADLKQAVMLKSSHVTAEE